MTEDRDPMDTLDVLADALWDRIRAIALAAHRLDRLPENEGNVTLLQGGEAIELAVDFVLRLFRMGSDSLNFGILSQLAQEASVPMVELARAIRLPPLAVSERVADLVQVGLAARTLIGDQVQATAATKAFVDLLEGISQALAARIAREWAKVIEEVRL